MLGRFQRADLVPEGFAVVSVHNVGEQLQIVLRARCTVRFCPDCGCPSRRVQGRYPRNPSDLPFGGRHVSLLIEARRFWCDCVVCSRRIFCEPFDRRVLARQGRRTSRLETIVSSARAGAGRQARSCIRQAFDGARKQGYVVAGRTAACCSAICRAQCDWH
ncbi:transposase family protein [Novosphingobium olei]|uniref:transposase family protein n=1 Tax=Novosphingobium olei TaxID=2728851 RepID=UPI003BB0A710